MAEVILEEEVVVPKRTISYGQARWTRARAHARPELRPVTIVQRRAHAFKKKPEGKKGCAECGEAKRWAGHHGAPPSLNVGGSSQNVFAYQNTKKLWQAIFTNLLEDAGLPYGLGRVLVEGRICFPTRAKRDQGNFRFMIEKALGDALQEGGWIEDDDWLHYECGRLGIVYAKGQSWTELTITPEWDSTAEVELAPEEPVVPGQLELVA